MDSDGIWNACTIKVITNMAITTVPSRDCAELTTSAPRVGTTRGCDGAIIETSGEATGTSGDAIGALEATKGCSGEATGWFDKFIEIYFSNLLVRRVWSLRWRLRVPSLRAGGQESQQLAGSILLSSLFGGALSASHKLRALAVLGM